MPERMRRRHIKGEIAILIQDKFYVVPRDAAAEFKLLAFLKRYRVCGGRRMYEDDSVPADEVFKELDQKYGKVGATIRGFRSREDMTQVELAKKLKTTLGYLAHIENGRRVVNKKMAHQLAKIFKTSYRLFI